jgi:hypothetical protein
MSSASFIEATQCLVVVLRILTRRGREPLIATSPVNKKENFGKESTIMKLKANASRLWLKCLSQGRAGIAAMVLFAAISVMTSGCGGGKTASAPVVPAPIISSFTAASNSINSGSSTTLSWSVSNATLITIGGVGEVTGNPSSVAVGAGSSASVSPTETTTYTLTASGTSGIITAKTTITVNEVVAATNCTKAGTLFTVGSGTTVVKVATAANFTNIFIFWLNNYYFNSLTNSNYTTDAANYTIDVCSDSTGNFESAIAAGTYVPNIFFAADTSNEGTSYSTESMEYAKGYPVLMGYTAGQKYNITGVGDLIQGLTGGSQDISSSLSGLSSYTISNTITGGPQQPGTLVTNPTLAPYGVAAVNILNATNPLVKGTQISYSPSINTTTVPSWVEPLATYSSVTKAYAGIGVSAPTGFAAFSLFCQAPPANAVWVRFTGPDVLTVQSVANLETNPGGGTDIYNLIKAQIGDSNQTWLKFITFNYGYGSCYASD